MEYKGSGGQQSCLLSLFVYIHTEGSQQKLWCYSIRQDSPYPKVLQVVRVKLFNRGMRKSSSVQSSSQLSWARRSSDLTTSCSIAIWFLSVFQGKHQGITNKQACARSSGIQCWVSFSCYSNTVVTDFHIFQNEGDFIEDFFCLANTWKYQSQLLLKPPWTLRHAPGSAQGPKPRSQLILLPVPC